MVREKEGWGAEGVSPKYRAHPEFQLENANFYAEVRLTTGQSNLTKSASWGAHSPVRGHPRGSKVVPLNSWGRVSY